MAGVTESTAPHAWRPVWATVFAAVCVVTTALGHALMSGDALPWWAVGTAFSMTAAGGWWLTGRERGAATVVGATVLVQGLLHLLFNVTHQLVRTPATAAGAPGAGRDSTPHQGMESTHSGMIMHHSGAHPGAVAESSGFSPVSVLTHQGSAGMLMAHLLAAAVCGLWLWRGEAAVHRIGRALAAVLFAPLRRICQAILRTRSTHLDPLCRGPFRGEEHRLPPTSALLRHAVIRRGPPRGRSTASLLSPDPLLAVGP
ncbi:hypothetical protein OG235_37065 [Streptomyces sp. NBC_00024]|uniref:hypothetical protein n=1 Tax=Streptomyces sp. NBC_00024 TaxID=2903612 RepID=UPI00324843A8